MTDNIKEAEILLVTAAIRLQNADGVLYKDFATALSLYADASMRQMLMQLDPAGLPRMQGQSIAARKISDILSDPRSTYKATPHTK